MIGVRQTGGSEVLPFSTFEFWFLPLTSNLTIAKWYALLGNFPQFLPDSALGIPLPGLSSPASRTPATPSSPELPNGADLSG